MYMILSHACCHGTGGQSQDPPRAHALDFPGRKEFAWTPQLSQPALPLRFLVDRALGCPDYLAVDNVVGGELGSRRLLNMLYAAGVPVLSYAAELADEATGEVLRDEFALWAPPRVAGTIDWERSRLYTNPTSGQRYITTIALSATAASAPLLFQPEEKLVLLVHDQLRADLESAGITGMEYLPLDLAHNPVLGRDKLEIERRLQDAPRDATLWTELAGVLWRLHYPEDALAAIDEAILLKPALGRAWYLRGVVLRTLRRNDEAMGAYAEATRLEPGYADAWLEYSAALCDARRFDDALASAKRALDDERLRSNAWHQIGVVHLASGSFGQALTAFSRSWDEVSGGHDPAWYMDQGDAQLSLGRPQEALALYDRGLAYLTTNTVMWRQKAKALALLGRPVEAQEAETQAQALDRRWQDNFQKTPR